jgi:hypothetical protein
MGIDAPRGGNLIAGPKCEEWLSLAHHAAPFVQTWEFRFASAEGSYRHLNLMVFGSTT